MDVSYIISCKNDHNVDKRSTDRDRLGFISCEYSDMNLEKIYILKDNIYTISDFPNG